MNDRLCIASIIIIIIGAIAAEGANAAANANTSLSSLLSLTEIYTMGLMLIVNGITVFIIGLCLKN